MILLVLFAAVSVLLIRLCKRVPLQLVYHSLQLVAFTVLAVLIMRLKLFLTPHMCIMASLVCSKQVRLSPTSSKTTSYSSSAYVYKLLRTHPVLFNDAIFLSLSVVWLDRGEV